MSSSLAPAKTPEGHAELTHRVRRLSQRHRTMLLLVDGRRSVAEVLQTAQAAGVPREIFDELLALGLVTLGGLTLAGMPPGELAAGDADHVELPLATEESQLPASRSLMPESQHSEQPASGTAAFDEERPEPLADPNLEEARAMLMRAVRNEAPVTGSLTLMKLRRATTREALEELLDEVEQRIRKPRKQIVAAQTIRHVRHLLSLPPH